MNYYIKNEGISSFEAAKMPGAAALTSALGPSKKTNIEAFNIDENNSWKLGEQFVHPAFLYMCHRLQLFEFIGWLD